MSEIRYYVAPDGKAPFTDWLGELNDFAVMKVRRAIERMALDNFFQTSKVWVKAFWNIASILDRDIGSTLGAMAMR